VTRWLVFAACAAGCGGQPDCTPAPAWTLAASGNIRARALPDDSLVVLVASVGPGMLGATAVDGPALVHVGADGAVLAAVHLPMTTAAADLRVDAQGGVAVIGDMITGIARYDTAFARVWSLDTVRSGPQFDIAPTGDVAYLSGIATDKLHYVDATGVERWSSDVPDSTTLRLGDTGDLYVFELAYQGASHRLHFAPDGTQLDEVDFPTIPDSAEVARDGSIVFVTDPYRTVLAKADASGIVWTLPLKSSTTSPIVSTDGDVLAVTDLATAVVRIDGATGTLRRQIDNCAVDFGAAFVTTPPLAAASASHYVVYEVGDGDPFSFAPLVGLDVFAGP
jgi:hypothetical protein